MSDNPTPNRRQRRAAAATGDTAVEQAAAAANAPIVTDPPVPASEVVAAPPAGSDLPDDTAVLPDPTLKAEPGTPAPIVTASPPLAAEPSAIDVVQADAAAERIATGAEEPGDRDRARPAVAGQTMLAIEGERHRSGWLDEERVAQIRRDVLGDDDLNRKTIDGRVVLSLDEITHGLELLAKSDPIGMDIIRTRFFPDAIGELTEHDLEEATVTVLEVVGPPQGRRRAGMMFGPQPRRFLASDLRADELDAIRTDPLLTVGVSELGEVEAGVAFADTIQAP